MEGYMPKLTVERRGKVTLFTLNRAEVHNNVDDELAMELADSIMAFGADKEANVLVVTGAGDKTFCAGANLKGMKELFEHRHTHTAGPMGFNRLDPGKPVIAAINGNCYAGGVELACWCDFRIVDERAKFGLLNKRWGLSLADGGTQRLPRVVGIGNALYMIETGMEIDAQNAYRMGLAQEVVPAGTALQRALLLAEHIADYSQGGIRADREAAIGTIGLSLKDGLDLEEKLCFQPALSDEAAAGMKRFVGGARPEPPRPVSSGKSG
jgi:enoyl-CoA hydratase